MLPASLRWEQRTQRFVHVVGIIYDANNPQPVLKIRITNITNNA